MSLCYKYLASKPITDSAFSTADFFSQSKKHTKWAAGILCHLSQPSRSFHSCVKKSDGDFLERWVFLLSEICRMSAGGTLGSTAGGWICDGWPSSARWRHEPWGRSEMKRPEGCGGQTLLAACSIGMFVEKWKKKKKKKNCVCVFSASVVCPGEGSPVIRRAPSPIWWMIRKSRNTEFKQNQVWVNHQPFFNQTDTYWRFSLTDTSALMQIIISFMAGPPPSLNLHIRLNPGVLGDYTPVSNLSFVS